jgi:hypothetical protein
MANHANQPIRACDLLVLGLIIRVLRSRLNGGKESGDVAELPDAIVTGQAMTSLWEPVAKTFNRSATSVPTDQATSTTGHVRAMAMFNPTRD